MKWLQWAWVAGQVLCIFAGLVSAKYFLVEIGLAGFLGFFVGWMRPEAEIGE
jgi:hypothetical protein